MPPLGALNNDQDGVATEPLHRLRKTLHSILGGNVRLSSAGNEKQWRYQREGSQRRLRHRRDATSRGVTPELLAVLLEHAQHARFDPIGRTLAGQPALGPQERRSAAAGLLV